MTGVTVLPHNMRAMFHAGDCYFWGERKHLEFRRKCISISFRWSNEPLRRSVVNPRFVSMKTAAASCPHSTRGIWTLAHNCKLESCSKCDEIDRSALDLSPIFAYQNCVFPLPGIPTNCVMAPSGIPSPIALSSSLHNVAIPLRFFSACQRSSALSENIMRTQLNR